MWRDELPALRACAYLNAGTNGPLPRVAAEAMAGELDRLLREPRIGPPAFTRMLDLRDRARGAAARAIGAAPADVALTGSTTAGVGIVVSGIDWDPGDEVVTSTEEHPGLTGPLAVLARRRNVRVRAVPAVDVAAAVGPRTRLVALSHVLWTTGAVVDTAPIADAARRVGALLLLDAAQAAGNVPVDVADTGADAYAVSGQKWLMGPMGSGALWVRPGLDPPLWPALPGYFSFHEGDVGRPKQGGEALDPGTIDTVTLAGFAAALEWVEGLPGGRAEWLLRAATRLAAAERMLAGVDGVDVVPVPEERAGLLALRLPDGADARAVADGLARRAVLVRSVPGSPFLRVSVGAFTDDADLAALAEGLAAELHG